MSRFRGNHGDQESVAIGSDEPDGDKIAPQSREHGEAESEKVFTGTEDVQKVVCFELLMLCTMNLCNFAVVTAYDCKLMLESAMCGSFLPG